MFRIANHHVSRITSILLLLEFSIAFISVYCGAMIRTLDSSFPFSLDPSSFFLTALVFASTIVFSMSALGMYQINFREGVRNTFLRLMP